MVGVGRAPKGLAKAADSGKLRVFAQADDPPKVGRGRVGYGGGNFEGLVRRARCALSGGSRQHGSGATATAWRGAARPRESLRQGPSAGEVLGATGEVCTGEDLESEGSEAGAQAKVCAGPQRSGRLCCLAGANLPLCRALLERQRPAARPPGGTRAPDLSGRTPAPRIPSLASRARTGEHPRRAPSQRGRSSPSALPLATGCQRDYAAGGAHPEEDTPVRRSGPASGWRKHGFQLNAHGWPGGLCPHSADRQGEGSSAMQVSLGRRPRPRFARSCDLVVWGGGRLHVLVYPRRGGST